VCGGCLGTVTRSRSKEADRTRVLLCLGSGLGAEGLARGSVVPGMVVAKVVIGNGKILD
jgi:hypothetical protein